MTKKTPDADCAKAIANAAGGKLTGDEVSDAFANIAAHKDALVAAGKTDNLGERLRAFAEREAERTKIAAAMTRKHAALNALVRDRLNQTVSAYIDAGLSPRQAMLALIEGTQKRVAAGRASVYALSQSYESRYLGGLMADLSKEIPHFRKIIRDKRFDDDVAREMTELRKDGSPGSTGNKDAQKAARIFANYAELSRTEANRLGASIGKLDGWAGAQTHDDLKVLAATKEGWVEAVLPRLDLARTLPDVTDDRAARDILGDVWDTIITSVPNKASAGEKGQRVNPANLARSLGASRVLHFKSADDALAYREQFGFGGTVSGMVAHLRRVASVNAQMQTFGPNPEVMVRSMTERMTREIRDAPVSEADRAAKVARFESEIAALNADQSISDEARSRRLIPLEAKRDSAKTTRIIPADDKPKQIEGLRTDGGPIRQALDIMTGLATRPQSVKQADIHQTVRGLENMAKLGGAWFSSVFSDPVTAGIAAQFRGTGFLKGLTDHAAGLLKGRPKGEQQEIAFMVGEGFDGLLGHISAAAASTDGPVGHLSKAQELFFRLSGLTPYTDAGRSVAGRLIAAEMGLRAKTGFAALPRAYRDLLSVHNITPQKWDAIRSAQFRESNGNAYVTPDRIEALSDQAIEPLVAKRIAAARKALRVDSAKDPEIRAEREAKFQERRAAILGDGRRELQLDVLGFIADEVNYGIIETDARSRRTTTMGLRPGTVSGEAIRYVMQFKGFPIAFGQRVLGRTGSYLARSDDSIVEKGVHLGTIVMSTAIAGYMAMTMKDLMRGYWPPRDPGDPRTWGAALQQGGGVGIYGDYLFGEYNRFGGGVIDSAVGPVAGEVSNIISLYQKSKDAALSSDKEVKAADFLTTAINNVPFANLFYVRPALDYLILNSAREAASPGYLARVERRRQKEYGQSSLYSRDAELLQ